MGQILIKNAYIVTMNAENQVYTNGSILIEDDKIIAVGKVDNKLVKKKAEKINAKGKYVLPGFVNTHVHTSQQLGRGLGDDVNLELSIIVQSKRARNFPSPYRIASPHRR